MRSKSYCIPIAPMPWEFHRSQGIRVFDKQMSLSTSVGIILEQQHDDEPLFDGPLKLDIIFYIRVPEKKDPPLHMYHITKPAYHLYLHFITQALKGTVVTSGNHIVAGSWLCKYDLNPRYELTISEIL